MSAWVFIEPHLTLGENLRLRFWFIGMDLFHFIGAQRAYLFCVAEAGALTYRRPQDFP